MDVWPWFCIAMGAFALVVYLLYRQGIAVSKCIAAVLFVFRPGPSSDRASLDSCTGWVRHVGRFRESRSYAFTLDDQLSAGNARVTVLSRDKSPLLQLDRQSPQGSVELDGKSRYYLRWEFQHATGRCELRW